jgi:1,2-diacylglycerol 3-alpha-glucosyltransferase
MKFAVCFTNFGPYHLARLRATALRLRERGSQLIAVEIASTEQRYPWRQSRSDEPFKWITLFPGRMLETITAGNCRAAMTEVLDQENPDAVAIAGYARAESMGAARWARWRGIPSILMSESQKIDRPHVWWKEMIKKKRLEWFDAALVGGPTHRDYLVHLGMPSRCIASGYNAVDNNFFATSALHWRSATNGCLGVPPAPYFLAVCRLVPEKNLIRLIKAFSRYRARCDSDAAWDLVICGNGPILSQLERVIAASGSRSMIHCPGFLQSESLARWYAHAGAFVLPSVSEPWGLVVNEAAASGLPLLVSSRAGCAPILVPEPRGTTGSQFDPLDVSAISENLTWMASLAPKERFEMGRRAADTVSHWAPSRFAQGLLEALDLAQRSIRMHSRPRVPSAKMR